MTGAKVAMCPDDIIRVTHYSRTGAISQKMYTGQNGNMPLWIQEGVSVLSILDVGGSVEGVGTRNGVDLFWLENKSE